MGNSDREVRIPNLRRGLPFGGASWPGPTATSTSMDAAPSPARSRPAPRSARSPRGSGGIPRRIHREAGPRPLPRRRPGLLRLLPPDRPGLGAPAPAAAPQAGGRRGLARARHRAPGGRLVAPADRRTAQAGSGRRDGRLPQDHLLARLRAGGPRRRPLPPPAQGAPPARVPPRPKAATAPRSRASAGFRTGRWRSRTGRAWGTGRPTC